MLPPYRTKIETDRDGMTTLTVYYSGRNWNDAITWALKNHTLDPDTVRVIAIPETKKIERKPDNG
jgi:hypothetical protein